MLDVSQPTLAAYRRLLERLYLTVELPGWTVGVSAKAGHRPKLHVSDTGLAAGALALSAQRLATSSLGGAFLESFVLNELMRQAATIDEAIAFAHFRDRSGIEVDVIVERPDGRVMAVEVKSARSVNRGDARGLTFLGQRLGSPHRLPRRSNLGSAGGCALGWGAGAEPEVTWAGSRAANITEAPRQSGHPQPP
jgi:predicted AAA+ superfamily ATPase